MPEYLVGMSYHEPESYAQWKAGVIEDYESSTGLFITANTPSAAIAWAERVAEALLRFANQDESLDWKGFGYDCWIEESPASGSWSHCLDFFQHVRTGEMPDLKQMGSAAYSRWYEEYRSRHGR